MTNSLHVWARSHRESRCSDPVSVTLTARSIGIASGMSLRGAGHWEWCSVLCGGKLR